MQFGRELREQRERRGISLDDVSVGTRVSVRHLEALENDRFTELPGGVFNRGIVRSYALHCGLDPDTTLDTFQSALRASGMDTEEREDDWRELAEAVHRNRTVKQPSQRIRWAGVAGMLLLLLALAAGVSWLLLVKGIAHLPEKKWLAPIRETLPAPRGPK